VDPLGQMKGTHILYDVSLRLCTHPSSMWMLIICRKKTTLAILSKRQKLAFFMIYCFSKLASYKWSTITLYVCCFHI